MADWSDFEDARRERQRDFRKAELEQPIAAARLAVIIALLAWRGSGARFACR